MIDKACILTSSSTNILFFGPKLSFEETMTFTEKELLHLKEDILRLKNKLQIDNNNEQYGASISIANMADPRSNRGSKLDPTSVGVSRMNLNSARDNYKLTSLEVYDNDTGTYDSKMVYVNKEISADTEEMIRRQVEEEFGSDDDDELDGRENKLVDESDDPYITTFNDILKTIKIDELIRPITKPSDVVNIKSVNSIFQEKYLDNLSNETINIIQREQELVNMLNKTMDIFLHDDEEHLAADNLGLPEYDHNLDLDKIEENGGTVPSFDPNNMQQDPFFQPSDYTSNPQFDNIDPEEVDETRQLLQIALQRNEEFIRALSQIRSGFLRADNYRRHVYEWCKEMNTNEIAQTQKASFDAE